MPFTPPPASVQRTVRAWLAESGERWLADLPDTVAALMSEWALRQTGAPLEGGTHSYVLPVERLDGTPAVLKVIYVDSENVAEATGLRAYDGEGAVRLYEYDPGSGAMLLERADPGEALLDHRFPSLSEPAADWRRIDIACGIYRRLWRTPGPLPEGYPGLPKASVLLSRWRTRFGEPDEALRTRLGPHWPKRAAELCADLSGPVAVGIANDDTHLSNIVSAEREPWLLIDPKPFLAERAYDAGFFLFKQQFHGPLGGGELSGAVAQGLGADVERVKAWAALRGIDYAVGVTEQGERDAVIAAVESILSGKRR